MVVNAKGHVLLVQGDWRKEGCNKVVGQLGPEGKELASLRQVEVLGTIPKTGATGEVEQDVVLLGVPERHALRPER